MLTTTGLAFSLLQLSGRSLVAGLAVLVIVVVAYALFVPGLSILTMAAAQPLARRLGGPVGAMACRGVTASLSNGAKDKDGNETGYGSGGDASRDLYFEMENLVGTNFDDSLAGNKGRNELNGMDGDDFLFGYDGIDQLRGGRGSDNIDGGAGSDTALFDANIGEYTVTKMSSNTVHVVAGGDTDILTDVEYFQFADTTVDIWSL